MQIDERRSALPSIMGSFCSILLLVVLFAYAGYKASILEGKKKVDIVQAVQENYFDDSYVFGAEQGLNIAVALTFVNKFHHIDPSYGRIVFRRLQVSID